MTTLLSPINLTKGKPFFSVSSSVDATYIDPITGNKVINNISIVDISEELKINQYAYASIKTLGPESVTYELVKQFEEIQNHLGRCVRTAELLNHELRQINHKLFALTEHERMDINTLDFMQLRDKLFDFLKKNNLLKDIEKYNSNQKIKPISKLFNQFILDRNIYTHGVLRMRFKEKDFVVEHKTSAKKSDYSIVDVEMLLSFNEAYLYLKEFLDKLTKAIQNHRKERKN